MGDSWRHRKRSRAVVRRVSPNFTNALASYFGTGPTDVSLSQAAHDDFVSALKENDVDVDILPGLSEYPDCTFVEDTAVVVGDVVVITNVGHPSREGEQLAIKEYLQTHIDVVQMPLGAKMDGGDVVFFDDRFLVGVSTRTNREGVEFLREVVTERGFDLIEFQIPESTLHLTTVCSSPRPGTIVAAEGHLTPEHFRTLEDEGVEILWVPNEEAYAANTIGFENGNLLVSRGYPHTKKILENAGFSVRVVDMEHIRAADGSLTCLSIFF
jgi:dimethylargininase